MLSHRLRGAHVGYRARRMAFCGFKGVNGVDSSKATGEGGETKTTSPRVSIARVRVSIRAHGQEHQNSGFFFKFNFLYKDLL
jgi:hypothetical protein